MNMNRGKIVKIVIFIVIGLISFFYLSDKMSSVEFHEKTLASLNEKQEDAIALTAGAAGLSVLVGLVLNDATDALSSEIAQLTDKFMFILTVIFLEKYLIGIAGKVAFSIIVPVACALAVLFLLLDKKKQMELPLRLIVFAIAITFLIPCSTVATNIMNETYEEIVGQAVETTDTVMDKLKQENAKTDKGNAATQSNAPSTQKKPAAVNNKAGNGSIFDTITDMLNDAKDAATGAVEKATSFVGDNIKNALQYAEDLLGKMVEAVAVMIVTTCLIPLGVLLGFVWITKIIFSIDLTPAVMGTYRRFPKYGSKIRAVKRAGKQ